MAVVGVEKKVVVALHLIVPLLEVAPLRFENFSVRVAEHKIKAKPAERNVFKDPLASKSRANPTKPFGANDNIAPLEPTELLDDGSETKVAAKRFVHTFKLG